VRHGGLAPKEEIIEEAVARGIERKDAIRVLKEMGSKVWYEPRHGFVALGSKVWYEPRHGFVALVDEPRPPRKASETDREGEADYREGHWPAGG